MKKRITAVCLCAALLLSHGAYAAGSPEGFAIPGWTINASSGKCMLDLECKNGGNASLACIGAEAGAIKASQKVTGLKPSTEYNFTFRAKTENATYFKMTRDAIYTKDVLSGTATSDWYEKTITFTTGKSKTEATFMFRVENGSVWIDDCTLTEAGSDVNLLENGDFEEGVDAVAPDPVTGVSTETDDGSCILRWTDSASSDAEKVIVLLNGEEKERVEKGIRQYRFDELTNGTEYEFGLVAIDAWENKSTAVTVKDVPMAQREAPTVSADDENNVIVGIDESMEYRIDNGEWTAYSSAPELAGTHIVEVRYKKTATLKEGKSKVLIFYKNAVKTESELSASVQNKFADITVAGTANKSPVSLLIMPANGSVADVAYAAEVMPENGKFEEKLTLPDFAARSSYVVSLNAGGKTLELSFSYVPSADVDAFAAALGEMSEDEIKSELENAANLDIIRSIGIDTDDYEGYFDAERAAATLKSAKSLNAEDFADIVGCELLISMLNKNNTAVGILEVLDKYAALGDLNFEKKAWADITDNSLKNKLCSEFAGETFKTIDEVRAFYKLKNIYYEINSGSYARLGEIMTTYADELELAGKTAYENYLSQSEYKKTEILKRVKLANDDYNNNPELLASLASAVSSAGSSGGSSGGTSSGGSSGGGSSSGSGKTQTIAVAAPVAPGYVSNEAEDKIFDDLEQAEWARPAIEALYKMGVVSGTGEKEFSPMANVTREQIAKMLVDAFDLTLSEIPDGFADVEEERWSYPYVMIMKDNGIIAGYEDGTFKPEKSITREELCVILSKICSHEGIKLTETRDAENIADLNNAADYAREALEKLYCAGIVNGTSDTAISPKGTATRAMAARLVYTLMKGDK